eukprot:1315153-Amphidinium_carterae.3
MELKTRTVSNMSCKRINVMHCKSNSTASQQRWQNSAKKRVGEVEGHSDEFREKRDVDANGVRGNGVTVTAASCTLVQLPTGGQCGVSSLWGPLCLPAPSLGVKSSSTLTSACNCTTWNIESGRSSGMFLNLRLLFPLPRTSKNLSR